MPVPPYLQAPLPLLSIAEQLWDLRGYPSQYVFWLLGRVSQDPLERDKCLELSSAEGQEDWLNYCRRPRRTILEVLHDFHKSASELTIEVLFELFPTIKPRSFSIAGYKPDQVDLLVAVVEYYSKLTRPRRGLCSNWLKDLQSGAALCGWIKGGTFKFPDPTTPYIMVGPGTGLAPFRSVVHYQLSQGTADSDNLHLFFGCRYRNKDYHCGDELERIAMEGKLSLYCAFSRDQENKVYVQHKIFEHSKYLWSLLSEGGHVFISGNAKNMPDNVRDAICDVICCAGGLTAEESRTYLKGMESRGQFQVETW